MSKAVTQEKRNARSNKKVIIAWLLALLLLVGIFGPIAASFIKAEDKPLLGLNVPTAGSADNKGGNDTDSKPSKSKDEDTQNPVFIGDVELNSVDRAIASQKLDFVLRFAEVNQNNGNLQPVFTKYVESLYLQESNSENFPFVLNRQAYPAQSIGIGSDKQYVNAIFKDLRVKDDVKDGVYELMFKVNYRDVKGQGELKTAMLKAYIRMIGFEKKEPQDAQIQFKSVNKSVPQARPGQWVPVYLDLANYGLDTVEILNTTLVIEGAPLIIQQADQTAIVELPLHPLTKTGQLEPSMENGTLIRVDYGSFQVSKEAASGMQKIAFDVTYLDAKKVLKHETVSTYINVIGGAGSKGGGSVPRVMIAGYKTNPEEIKGGEPFILTLTLKNTSEISAVSNMRLNVSSKDPERGQIFMPEDGATAFFIKQIAPNGEMQYDLHLNSSASLNQKAYPLDISLEYQDDSGNSYNTNEQISLYVHQNVRIDFGKVEVSPQDPTVGSEVNIFFNLINKGRVKLYNAELVFAEDGALRADPIFIGDVESGKTTQVDANVIAQMPNNGEPAKFKLRFEDENGKVSELEHSFEINIMENMPQDSGMALDENGNPIVPGVDGGEFPGQEDSGNPAWKIIAFIVIILILALSLVWFILKQRKRKANKTIRVKGEEF